MSGRNEEKEDVEVTEKKNKQTSIFQTSYEEKINKNKIIQNIECFSQRTCHYI